MALWSCCSTNTPMPSTLLRTRSRTSLIRREMWGLRSAVPSVGVSGSARSARENARDDNGTATNSQSGSEGLRDWLEACQKLCRRCVPGECPCALRADITIELQSRAYGHGKVLVKDAGHTLLDHVDRAGYRKCRNGHSAGERLDHRQTESVGEAGKNQDIGAANHTGQLSAMAVADELLVRVARCEVGSLGPVTDDHLGTLDLEIEKGVDVLFDGQPAAVGHDRARQARQLCMRRTRMKALQVYPSAPKMEVLEAPVGE